MDLTKVTRNGQVTIPKSVRDSLDIKEGDYLEVVRVPQGILLRIISESRTTV